MRWEAAAAARGPRPSPGHSRAAPRRCRPCPPSAASGRPAGHAGGRPLRRQRGGGCRRRGRRARARLAAAAAPPCCSPPQHSRCRRCLPGPRLRGGEGGMACRQAGWAWVLRASRPRRAWVSGAAAAPQRCGDPPVTVLATSLRKPSASCLAADSADRALGAFSQPPRCLACSAGAARAADEASLCSLWGCPGWGWCCCCCWLLSTDTAACGMKGAGGPGGGPGGMPIGIPSGGPGRGADAGAGGCQGWGGSGAGAAWASMGGASYPGAGKSASTWRGSSCGQQRATTSVLEGTGTGQLWAGLAKSYLIVLLLQLLHNPGSSPRGLIKCVPHWRDQVPGSGC
jgi:hypothetical protein